MKKIILYLSFLLFCIPSFSLNFGFDVNQENIFSEKTEYIPAFFDSTQTDIFVNFSYSFNNCLVSVYPNFCFKDVNLYFNIYKFKFNLFFDTFAFSLDKDIFYYGKGSFENLSIPQSITIKDKNVNSWHSKFDFFFLGQTISIGALLDKKIDYYKTPSYLNPFFIFNFTSTYFNLIYGIDYLWQENDSLKNSLELEFLSTNDLSLYSTLSYVTDFTNENELRGNIGISKAFIFKNFIICPSCELKYNFFNNNPELSFNLHSDCFDFFNLDTGISYSNSNTEKLNLRTEINFYLKLCSIRILYQSTSLLKNEMMNKGFFSLGVKYEI